MRKGCEIINATPEDMQVVLFVNLLGLGRYMNSCMFILDSRRDGRVVECTALLKGIRDFTMIF